MFNIDGYWLGAPVAGMTYRTAGPQYQQILRTSLEPVLADLEAVWSDAWVPRGQTVHFDRNQLLRDDLTTTATALQLLVGAGIISPAEARDNLSLFLDLSIAGPPPPPPTPAIVPPPPPAPDDNNLDGEPDDQGVPV
jgi:hypothetical protein